MGRRLERSAVSEWVVLWLLLVVLYLLECFHWNTQRGACLVVWAKGRAGLRTGWGLTLNKFLPIGYFFRFKRAPVFFAAEGLYLPQGTELERFRFIAYASLSHIEQKGAWLHFGAERHFEAASGQDAAALKAKIEAALALQDQAVFAHEAMHRLLDTKLAAQQAAAFQAQTRWLRRLSASLTFLLLIGLPAAWHLLDFSPWVMIVLLPLLLLNYLAVPFFFRVSAKQLLPDAKAERRIKTLMTSVTIPSAALAANWLSLDLAAGFHPLAVAAVYMKKEKLEQLCRQLILEQEYLIPGRDNGGRSVLDQCPEKLRPQWEKVLRDWMQAQGLDPVALRSAPQVRDEKSLVFCPRCHTQYSVARKLCSDCSVELKGF